MLIGPGTAARKQLVPGEVGERAERQADRRRVGTTQPVRLLGELEATALIKVPAPNARIRPTARVGMCNRSPATAPISSDEARLAPGAASSMRASYLSSASSSFGSVTGALQAKFSQT